MNDLIGEPYRRTTQGASRRLDRGQICWGTVLYLPPQAQNVSISSCNPQDERHNRYAVVPYDSRNVSTLFEHTPVHEIKLENNEELFVIKAKRRPVIVISQQSEVWPSGDGRLAEDGLVCIPIYSFQNRDSVEFRNRIRAHEYLWWLYLPNHVGLREGFARLDRIQVIERSYLEPMVYALTDDALWFFSEWLSYYLTEEIDPVLLEYREELLQSLS